MEEGWGCCMRLSQGGADGIQILGLAVRGWAHQLDLGRHVSLHVFSM